MKVYHTNNKEYCVPDMNLEDWYQDILKTEKRNAGYTPNKVQSVMIATELQLLRLRLGVAEGDFEPFTLFVYTPITQKYEIGRDGRIIGKWPDFGDIMDDLLTRIININAG